MDKKRIVLVEDETVIALDIESDLVQLGYEVSAIVSSGEEAIRAATEMRPDLVLMDITLAGPMSGIEAAAEIRRSQNIPIIFLTAHIDPRTTEDAIKTQPFGYLLKPVDMKHLAIMIDNAIYKSAADAKIRESEERYRQLVELAMSVILRWDTRGTVTFINEYGAILFGYWKEDLVGRNLMGTIVDETDTTGKNLRAMIEEIVIYPEKYLTNQNENTTKDGRHLWMHWRNSAILDHNGKLVEILSIGSDITEQRRMEEELRLHREQLMHLVEERTGELKRTNEKLLTEIAQRERMEAELLKAQKIESLGVLAGGIAHDFNNLLTTVMGNVSLALFDLDEGHPARKQLIKADRALLRAQELTQQLLTFSRGGAPVKRAIAIGELLRESTGFALRGARVRCEFTIPDDLWLVDADEGQISQVLHNLAINADQAMPEGGTITIYCENAVLAEGVVPRLAPGRYVKVRIEDSGIGIPGDHLAKIFDPYFTTKQRGSGLGLATAYSIVQKHGGHIAVASKIGAGATFTLYLPASTGARAAKKREEAKPLTAGSGTLLIMDDEESVRRTAGDALARFGYSAAFAENGSRTIELYQQALEAGKPFDAVIMDLTIPGGMGGKETLQRLVEIDPAVKAIVCSGYSNDPIMAEYRSHGFAGVVAKPYRIRHLVETVSRVIAEKGPGKGAGE